MVWVDHFRVWWFQVPGLLERGWTIQRDGSLLDLILPIAAKTHWTPGEFERLTRRRV